MKPTKEMIAAVEYMAESGKCDEAYCNGCPGYSIYSSCTENWSDGEIRSDQFDKTLQTSAKNWLKENKEIIDKGETK